MVKGSVYTCSSDGVLPGNFSVFLYTACIPLAFLGTGVTLNFIIINRSYTNILHITSIEPALKQSILVILGVFFLQCVQNIDDTSICNANLYMMCGDCRPHSTSML